MRISDWSSVLCSSALPVDPLFASPQHPYTRGLLASLPVVGRRRVDLEVIPGLPPDPVELPPGCAFYPRCSHRLDPRCSTDVPPLREVGPDHRVATFYEVPRDRKSTCLNSSH